MNKTLYNILGYFLFVGKIIQSKTNFFTFKCSPFMSEFTKTNDHKVLTDWLKSHPDKVLSPKIAKQIIEKTNKNKL